jgi:hypothetical protein
LKLRQSSLRIYDCRLALGPQQSSICNRYEPVAHQEG